LECHDESQNEHLVFNSIPKAIVATTTFIFHKKHVLMSCSCFASIPHDKVLHLFR
jgi:hypothetical protein